MDSTAQPSGQLTRKECQLLQLLEENPGQCLSRSYLLKTVWGYSGETRTRTVDVHVSRLRKKLQGRTDIAIHTVVNQGYVLQFNRAARPEPRGPSPSEAERKARMNGRSFSARA